MECFEYVYQTALTANWKRHLKSFKHMVITGGACECGQVLSTASNRRRHSKVCDIESTHEIVARLSKENKEREERLLKELVERDERHAREQAEREERCARDLPELAKQNALENAKLRHEMSSIVIPTSQVSNSFNLQVFLNGVCANSVTIEDFMQDIPLQLESTESMGKMILSHLGKCALEDRPIHCTDAKRGKLVIKYRKDEGSAWELDQKKVDSLIDQNVTVFRQRLTTFVNGLLENDPAFLENERRIEDYVRYCSMASADMEDKFRNDLAKSVSIPKDK